MKKEILKDWIQTICYFLVFALIVFLAIYFYNCSRQLKSDSEKLSTKIYNDSIAFEKDLELCEKKQNKLDSLYHKERDKKTREKTVYGYMSKEEQIEDIESRMPEY